MRKKIIILLIFIFFILLSVKIVNSQAIYGKLVNNTSNPLSANISAYQQGTITNSSLTVDGNYSFAIQQGVYDLNYDIFDFIPNFFIRLLSLNVVSDVKDKINYVTKYDSKISFTIDSNGETIQLYSEKRPNRISANNTNLTEAGSLSQLTNNTWFYDSTEKKLYMIVVTQQTCSGGVPYGQCSSNKPKYCDNGNLIDKCSLCNCSTGYNCLANESCNSTTIADYYVIGSGGSYTAKNSSGNTILTGTNAVTVISAVLNLMTSGQRVAFSGDFTIDSTITVNKGNLYFDFSQATVNSSAMPAFSVHGNYNTFYGGPYDPFTGQGAHCIWTGCAIWDFGIGGTVDGFEFKDSPIIAPIVPAGGAGSSGHGMIIQNCYFHDNRDHIVLNNGGGNFIIRNKLGAGGTGIMCNEGVPNNTIDHCEFVNFGISGGNHAIYLSGDSATVKGGNNVVKNCTFHHGNAGAGILIKCRDNDIHDNDFHDLPSTTVAFSIYSEWEGWTANENKIYDNTFTNCYQAFWIHGGNRDKNNNCIGEETNDNEVYSNNFTNVDYCFFLDHIQCYWVRRTKIYYNKFISCGAFIKVTATSPPNMVSDTVVAYNDFSQTTITDERFKTEYQDSLVYGNIGMDDYPNPLPPDLPIPPR